MSFQVEKQTVMEYINRWNPRARRGADFHPSKPRQQDAPPTITPFTYSGVCESAKRHKYPIYSTIKVLASFMNRNNVSGFTVKGLARNMYDELRIQKYRPDLECYCTLMALAEFREIRGVIYYDMYSYIYQFFSVYLHDLETRNPRHKCDRSECDPNCILPLYSNRCMPDTKVAELFSGLQDVLNRNPTLISTTEAKSAKNLLKFLITFGDGSLKDSYDVLYAMSGHHGFIFDPTAFVDSKLYEMLFDHLILFGADCSVPWLNEQAASDFDQELLDLQRYGAPQQAPFESDDVDNDAIAPDDDADDDDVFGTQPEASGGGADRDAPPSYDSVITRGNDANDNSDDQLPTYEEALSDPGKKIGTETRV